MVSLLAIFLIVLPAIVCSVAGTILGWTALAKISESEGRLYGRRLALFAGLFFPTLILAATAFVLVEIGAASIAKSIHPVQPGGSVIAESATAPDNVGTHTAAPAIVGNNTAAAAGVLAGLLAALATIALTAVFALRYVRKLKGKPSLQINGLTVGIWALLVLLLASSLVPWQQIQLSAAYHRSYAQLLQIQGTSDPVGLCCLIVTLAMCGVMALLNKTPRHRSIRAMTMALASLALCLLLLVTILTPPRVIHMRFSEALTSAEQGNYPQGLITWLDYIRAHLDEDVPTTAVNLDVIDIKIQKAALPGPQLALFPALGLLLASMFLFRNSKTHQTPRANPVEIGVSL